MALPFRERVAQDAAGSSDTLKFAPPPDGMIRRIQRVAFEDETTTPTGRLRIGVQGHGYTHWLDEVPAPAVGRLYVFGETFDLFPLEQLVAIVVGATAGDDLRLYVSGDARDPNEAAVLDSLVRILLEAAFAPST